MKLYKKRKHNKNISLSKKRLQENETEHVATKRLKTQLLIEQRENIDFHTQLNKMPVCPNIQKQFEQCPETAVLMYYLILGHLRFHLLDTIEISNQYKYNLNQIINEIKAECPQVNDINNNIKKFFKFIGRGGYEDSAFNNSFDVQINICGCCGIEQPDRDNNKYFDIPLSLLHVLKLDTNDQQWWDFTKEGIQSIMLPINDEGGTKMFDLSKAWPISETNNGDYFWLHKEAIFQNTDGTNLVKICEDCKKSLFSSDKQPTIPELSCKYVMLGNWRATGITYPNQMERFTLARVRHHFRIVKITLQGTHTKSQVHSHSAIRGHSILFDQDSFEVALEELFTYRTISRIFKLHFVASNNTIDELMKYTLGCTILQLRPFVLVQWLTALWYWNP